MSEEKKLKAAYEAGFEEGFAYGPEANEYPASCDSYKERLEQTWKEWLEIYNDPC